MWYFIAFFFVIYNCNIPEQCLKMHNAVWYFEVSTKGKQTHRRDTNLHVLKTGIDWGPWCADVQTDSGFSFVARLHLQLVMCGGLNYYHFITLTTPYNRHPGKPHFICGEVTLKGVYIRFFLFWLQNIDCGYSLEPPRTSPCNWHSGKLHGSENNII